MRSGTVDMGFISLPSELPGEIVPVCSDRLPAVLPAGHPLADRDAVPIAAFGTEPVVSLVDSTNRDKLRVLDAAHVHPDIRFQTADDYAMISMVESGLGICIAHELVRSGPSQRRRARSTFRRTAPSPWPSCRRARASRRARSPPLCARGRRANP